MSCQVKIRLLVEKLGSSRNVDGFFTIFIDSKSAYNTVNRDKLYEILGTKKILDEQEIRLMKSLHNALYFKSEDKHIILWNGLHLGFSIIPGLFDIYMEEVMAKLQSLF